jgi:hypothetical protein
MMGWHIKKLNYSAKPWRVVDDYGAQIHRWEEVETSSGRFRTYVAVSADTKAELVDIVLEAWRSSVHPPIEEA